MGEGGSRRIDSTSSDEKCNLLEWEKLLPQGIETFTVCKKQESLEIDRLRMGRQLFEEVLHVVPLYNTKFFVYLQENVFLVKISSVSNYSCHGSINVPWHQRHRLGYMNIVLCGGFFDTPTHHDIMEYVQ